MTRGSVTERIGVHLIGSLITKLGWVFREETVMDYGIDATVEERKSGIPTGKLLSLQIKTGSSFVERNSTGDFDFYIKPVHLEYWLNYQIPVILVICDPDRDILYWRQIAKRNLTETTAGKYKISILKTSVMSTKSLSELETIINTYSPTNNFDIDISTMTTEEVAEYALELISHSKDSLSSITAALEKYQKSTGKYKCSLEKLHADLTSHRVKNEQEKQQRIKLIGQTYKVATNVLTQRLVGNEKQIAIDTHISAFCFVDKALGERETDIRVFAQIVTIELESECQSIISVIELLNQFADQCENSDKNWGLEFTSAMKSCAMALKDYAADLAFFVSIISKQKWLCINNAIKKPMVN